MSNEHQISSEIEIKLNLGSFTNYLKLMGFLGQTEKEERHLNAFFDTEDRQLSKAGWAGWPTLWVGFLVGLLLML